MIQLEKERLLSIKYIFLPYRNVKELFSIGDLQGDPYTYRQDRDCQSKSFCEYTCCTV
jgi:hypothetical protein